MLDRFYVWLGAGLLICALLYNVWNVTFAKMGSLGGQISGNDAAELNGLPTLKLCAAIKTCAKASDYLSKGQPTLSMGKASPVKLDSLREVSPFFGELMAAGEELCIQNKHTPFDSPEKEAAFATFFGDKGRMIDSFNEMKLGACVTFLQAITRVEEDQMNISKELRAYYEACPICDKKYVKQESGQYVCPFCNLTSDDTSYDFARDTLKGLLALDDKFFAPAGEAYKQLVGPYEAQRVYGVKPGMSVMDTGSASAAAMERLADLVGPKGRVIMMCPDIVLNHYLSNLVEQKHLDQVIVMAFGDPGSDVIQGTMDRVFIVDDKDLNNLDDMALRLSYLKRDPRQGEQASYCLVASGYLTKSETPNLGCEYIDLFCRDQGLKLLEKDIKRVDYTDTYRLIYSVGKYKGLPPGSSHQ